MRNERESAEAREAVLELQLTEATDQVEALEKDVRAKQQELDQMEQDLA
jgi:predicted  nucleic acid-binding Zn-ribbon protein